MVVVEESGNFFIIYASIQCLSMRYIDDSRRSSSIREVERSKY
jgi:hypothetical protein